jgi:hypothetical protein
VEVEEEQVEEEWEGNEMMATKETYQSPLLHRSEQVNADFSNFTRARKAWSKQISWQTQRLEESHFVLLNVPASSRVAFQLYDTSSPTFNAIYHEWNA